LSKLILVRHAESIWNKENRFTGDIDVGLSLVGVHQALDAAKSIPHFDKVYTSALFRCKMTAALVLASLNKKFSFSDHPVEGLDVPVQEDARLNERDYGELKGQDKSQVLEMYGREQFMKWRRGYQDRPPGGESLHDVTIRVKKFLEDTLLPDLDSGKDVLIVAHGNSLRALIKVIEALSDEAIVDLEIPVMNQTVYEMKKGVFTPLK
jgi:2,3-bisphosphoglycerate-dependent phosphoglycerate mutase